MMLERVLVTILILLAFCDSSQANDSHRFLTKESSKITTSSGATSDNESGWTERKYVHTPLEANTTASPTAGPTQSLAPSTAPSTEKPTKSPTDEPTNSMAPSRTPSDNPTSSPSVYPSALPSSNPTTTPYPTATPSRSPSDFPSVSPSISPTMTPTVSDAPSSTPTNTPSDSPSVSPTISNAPSSEPSVTPTISSQPSSSPTLTVVATASFEISMNLNISTTFLTDTDLLAFEVGTSSWIEEIDLEDGKLTSVVTSIQTQSQYNASSGSRRSLAETTTPVKIDFSVAATYSGQAESFDLFKKLNPLFQNQNELWIRSLAKQSNIFEPYLKSISDLEQNVEGNKSTNSIGAKGIGSSGASILAGSALVLGIFAAVYSLKSYKSSMFGEELRSPTTSADSDDIRPGFQRKVLSQPSGGIEDNRSFRVDDDDDTATSFNENVEIQGPNDYAWDRQKPVSPNTLEKGRSGDDDGQVQALNYLPSSYQNNNSDYLATIQQYQRPFGKDPPSAASEVSFGNHPYSFKPDPMQGALLDNHSDMLSQFGDLVRNRLDRGSGLAILNDAYANEHNDATDTDDDGASSITSRYRSDNISEPRSSIDTGAELLLTSSRGGTLGASAISGNYAESIISDTSEFFFVTKKNPSFETSSNRDTTVESDIDQATLGARPFYPVEQEQLQEMSSYESASARAGLYDVFAPAGPIGIVVDTTKHGPAVHSLKPTSPMLGLINPGDLIVGLDDMDTRSMTAASLTRLMARKSNQKERKITLLAAEHYN